MCGREKNGSPRVPCSEFQEPKHVFLSMETVHGCDYARALELSGFPGVLYVITRALIREKENGKIQNYRPDWGRWRKNYNSKNMGSLLRTGSNALSELSSRPE